jgi:integrase
MRPPRKRYRSSPNGSYMLDRDIRGVGHIHMASGLYRENQFDILNDGITELAKDERGRAILKALLDRSLPPLELFAACKAKDFTTLAVGSAAVPLMAALERWREATKADVAKRTYEVRGELIAHLRPLAAPTTPVAALPALLRTLKNTMQQAPRSFNLDLAYASAFVRDTLGRRNPLYLDVRDIDPRPLNGTTDRRPLTPWEVKTLADTFDRVWKATQGSRGREVIAMALTGMGPTEYWGEWAAYTHHVHIHGPKRKPRIRDIPKLFPCAIYQATTLPRPAITASSFARALNIARVATGIDCTPYDLRRTFGNWMEQAGILRSRRKQYLGHAIGDVTERYERHDVERFLIEDGTKLRAWIDANASHEEKGPNFGKSPSLAPSQPFIDREVPLSDSGTL